MAPFLKPRIHCRRWCAGRKIRREQVLVRRLLQPAAGETVLLLGAGAPFLPRFLHSMGLSVSGVDENAARLALIRRRAGHRVDLHRHPLADLPFDDNSFTYSVLCYTLETAHDPEAVLEQAFRVTRDRVFIGLSGKYSVPVLSGALHRRFRNPGAGPGGDPPARHYSVWELIRMIHRLAGRVPVIWRTVYHVPFPRRAKKKGTGSGELLVANPAASFIGMCVTLTPRYRTTPLALKQVSSPLARPVGTLVSSPGRSETVKGRDEEWGKT